MSTTRAYGARLLFGGGIGAMDKIDGSLLNDQDKCFTTTETAVLVYNLDEFSGAAEDIPRVIAPDSELAIAGNKRWLLIGVITDSQRGDQSMITGVVSTNITFDYPMIDTGFQVVTGIVNNVDGSPSQYGMVVKNVTVNGFTVDFSGAMDTDNYVLHWIVSRDLIL